MDQNLPLNQSPLQVPIGEHPPRTLASRAPTLLCADAVLLPGPFVMHLQWA